MHKSWVQQKRTILREGFTDTVTVRVVFWLSLTHTKSHLHDSDHPDWGVMTLRCKTLEEHCQVNTRVKLFKISYRNHKNSIWQLIFPLTLLVTLKAHRWWVNEPQSVLVQENQHVLMMSVMWSPKNVIGSCSVNTSRYQQIIFNVWFKSTSCLITL